MKKITLIAFVVILIDQFSKIYIKTHFHLDEGKRIFDWFYLKFVENPGMAYGAQFGGLGGKIGLSVLRIFLIAGIAWYIYKSASKHNNHYFKISMGLIFAGAIGNLIDSLFYGMIFNTGLTWHPEINEWVGYSGISKMDFAGYSGFLKGCVVDMFYFPLFDFDMPDWVPIWGGKHISFFNYIFNVADSAITIGGAILLIFGKKVFAVSNS